MNMKQFSLESGRQLLAMLVFSVTFLLPACTDLNQSSDDISINEPSSDILRVVAPRRERVTATLSPYGPGYEYELVTRFARESGYAVSWIEAATMEDALEALEQQRGDLAVGFGGDLPIAPPHKPEETIAPVIPVVAGPVYAHYNPVLIHSTRRYGLRQNREMCTTPVLVTADPMLEEILEAKADSLQCRPMAEVSQSMELTPVLQAIDDNSARFAMLDKDAYNLWQPFYPGVRTAKVMAQQVPYRWFWRGDDDRLDQTIRMFWAAREKDTLLDNMEERYFGFLPDRVDRYEVTMLGRVLEAKAPQYLDTIVAAAQEQNIDPLLLIAVIYQESRFDPEARSKTGVRGLMMITQDTARSLGIDRLDPQQSIHGGARYLRMLWESLEDMGLEPWDRWFFALAAYNQGPGHLFDAIKLSRARGATGSTWRELKETYPLLAWERWYRNTKHGYCRGFEAVAYVENIRLYYYILSGLVSLARPEAENLGAFLSALPAHRPGSEASAGS